MELKVLTLVVLLLYTFLSEPYINKEIKEPVVDIRQGYKVNPCNCN